MEGHCEKGRHKAESVASLSRAAVLQLAFELNDYACNNLSNLRLWGFLELSPREAGFEFDELAVTDHIGVALRTARGCAAS